MIEVGSKRDTTRRIALTMSVPDAGVQAFTLELMLSIFIKSQDGYLYATFAHSFSCAVLILS
jgi:hypothetical protein